MKNLLSITVCLLIATLQLTASNIPEASPLNVFQNEKVIVLNPLSENAAKTFSITNAFGEVVFNQKLDKYDNAVKFNLTKLPSGQYTIRLSGDNFVEEHIATITDQTLNVDYIVAYYRPTVVGLDKKVTIEADLMSEKINVSIFDEAGILVYDYDDQKLGKFEKTFNLTQLERGEYNVVVSTEYFVETSTVRI